MTDAASTAYSEGMPFPAHSAPGLRQQNLSRVLQLVHREGAQSRAALTEATGLNRSTIADLVVELATLGLVTESLPGAPGRVGRPSPVVSPSGDVVAIAANPEVDALEIAAVGLDRRIVVRERIDNAQPPGTHDTAQRLAERLAAWRDGPLTHARVVAVGIAVPGLVRAADGLVRNAPHLEWFDAPLAEQVAAATGIRTVVDNDATLGARAEHLYGAARGLDDVVYLNGGASGIGGGLIIHGRPVTGAAGYAGEFGQNRPGIAHEEDRRASDGVLETEVNRRRLLDILGLRTADDDTLTEALAESTQAEVLAELARQRRILASALANAVNVLNPSVVVLGGFLATIAELGRDELMAEVGRYAMRESTEELDIRSAALGADRLLIGAAEIAFDDLLRDPAAG